MEKSAKKLYKARRGGKVDGVCKGMADYFNLDPTVVRLGWIVVGLLTAIFPVIVMYVVCMIIMPREPEYFDHV